MFGLCAYGLIGLGAAISAAPKDSVAPVLGPIAVVGGLGVLALLLAILFG
jgi:hypothetical protein